MYYVNTKKHLMVRVQFVEMSGGPMYTMKKGLKNKKYNNKIISL